MYFKKTLLVAYGQKVLMENGEVTAKWYGVSFEGDENVLKLIMTVTHSMNIRKTL